MNRTIRFGIEIEGCWRTRPRKHDGSLRCRKDCNCPFPLSWNHLGEETTRPFFSNRLPFFTRFRQKGWKFCRRAALHLHFSVSPPHLMREYWTSDFAEAVLALIALAGFAWKRDIPGVYPRHAEPLTMKDFYCPEEICRGKTINFPRALEKHGTFEIRAITLWEKELPQIRWLVLELKKLIESWQLNSKTAYLLKLEKFPRYFWIFYRNKWRESTATSSYSLYSKIKRGWEQIPASAPTIESILKEAIFPPESLLPLLDPKELEEAGYSSKPSIHQIVGW